MRVLANPICRDDWQRAASSFADYNYRHLWGFGTAAAARVGATSEHKAFYDGKELVGLADVRVKRLPFLRTGIAYINGGPLVRLKQHNEGVTERLQAILTQLVDTYVKQQKLLLRVQPALGDAEGNGRTTKAFVESGFSVCNRIRPYRTIIVDISPSLDTIRKQFNRKWRNHLNNSERRGLEVKSGTATELFDLFGELYSALRTRKRFQVQLSPQFYGQIQECLSECERFVVTIVYYNGEPVAGHVASVLGDTCVYLLGATNEVSMKNKSAYLAQWHVIQMARARGCRFYDLGGIDPVTNPGVYNFKKGLGGQDVAAPGPFEYAPDVLRQVVLTAAEKGYGGLQRLRHG